MAKHVYRTVHLACLCAFAMLASTAIAAAVKGTVTNKTAGRPAAGDSVALVDVQAGMADAATTTTDAKGQYTVETPGAGPYLVRVTHQGATYFIAAPQGGASGDVTVYDAAARVDGVSIDADMLLVEGAGGMLRVQERYLVRNTSLPPTAQFSEKTFEVVLPGDAELDGASATRPGGLGTVTRLVPLQQKGHYSFNVPIIPDQGQKETMFEVQYHISYGGKYTFKPQLQMPADNLVVYVPKSMTFVAPGAEFQPAQDDPRVLTNIMKNVHPGQAVAFTVSGEGTMPRDTEQRSGMSAQAAMGMGSGGTAATSTVSPGGGIGTPIGTPDPLARYKWWILSALTLLLTAGAYYFLRGRGLEFANDNAMPAAESDARAIAPSTKMRAGSGNLRIRDTEMSLDKEPKATAGNTVLLHQLKEELFALESERLCGTISQEDYEQTKVGLEAVLKRALKKAQAS